MDVFQKGFLEAAPSVPAALPSGGAGFSVFKSDFAPSNSPTQAKPEVAAPKPPPAPGFFEGPLGPVGWIGGMLKNAVGDVGEMVKGIGTLAEATVHDIGGAALEVIPGEQGGWERSIQQGGYTWARIAENAGHMMADDYASRYGFHGAEEMVNQIYSNPLSYVMDALMAGDAVAAGARLGGRAGLLSAETVAKVRGITPELEAAGKFLGAPEGKPTSEFGTLIGQGMPADQTVSAFASEAYQGSHGGMTGITTSVNPLKRAIQNGILKHVLSRSTEKVDQLVQQGRYGALGLEGPEANPIQWGDAMKALENARTQEGRILRPGTEKFITTRAARAIAGLTKQNFYGERNQMVLELKAILEGTAEGSNPELVKLIQGNNWVEKLLKGEAIDLNGLPYNGPKVLDHGDIPVLSQAPVPGQMILGPDGIALPPVSIDSAARRQWLETVEGTLKQAPGTTPLAFNTPFSTSVDLRSDAARATALTPDITDAGTVARQIEAASGNKLVGVLDTLGQDGAPWKGLTYFYDSPTGMHTLNVSTPQLNEAQKIISLINQHLEQYSGVYSTLEKEQASILEQLGGNVEALDPALLSPAEQQLVERFRQIGDQLPNVQEELDAASRMAGRVWDHPMRLINSPEGYDPELQMVDALYNHSMKWNLHPMAKFWDSEWVNKGLRGPYTVAINRAFMPMKINLLDDILMKGRQDIEQMIKDANTAGSTNEDLAHALEVYLRDTHKLPATTVEDIMYAKLDEEYFANAQYAAKQRGQQLTPQMTEKMQEVFKERQTWGADLPEDPFDAIRIIRKDPEKGARYIEQRTMNKIRMPVLRGEFEKGSTEMLDAWNWRTFADSMPQLPGYYPHIRMDSPQGLFLKQGAKKLPPMGFQKGFKGFLQESGTYLDDPFKAYSLRSYQLLRHEELIDQLTQMTAFGRELTEGELSAILDAKQTGVTLKGQVLISPDYTKNKIGLHSEYLDNIAENVQKNGMLYEDAAKTAISDLNKQLQEQTLKDLAESKVYAIPQHVAKQFEASFLKAFSPAKMRLFWDKPRDLWIASVLGLNPRWFLYRMMGNIIFTGITDPAAIPRLFGWVNSKNNRVAQMLLDDTLVANGQSVGSLLSRGYAQGASQLIGAVPGAGKRLHEWGTAADEFGQVTNAADVVYNSGVGRFFRGITQRVTNRVNIMEQAERRGVAMSAYGKMIGRRFDRTIDLIRHGAEEGFDQATVGRLMTETDWTLGNYTNLSPFERDIVRRFLMPFYPFYRHMLKFATRLPWDHPLKGSVLMKLHQMDQEMGQNLPDYLGSAIYLGQIGGMPTYWNITHYNPLAELALPESSPLNMVDPRIMVPLHAWTGTDEFMRPFRAHNVYEAPNGVQLVRTGTGWEPFEGIQHEPWSSMILNAIYGGPGSQVISAATRGYNQPWWKIIAAQGGLSWTQVDLMHKYQRELEAKQAAMSSPTARQVPYTYGS